MDNCHSFWSIFQPTIWLKQLMKLCRSKKNNNKEIFIAVGLFLSLKTSCRPIVPITIWVNHTGVWMPEFINILVIILVCTNLTYQTLTRIVSYFKEWMLFLLKCHIKHCAWSTNESVVLCCYLFLSCCFYLNVLNIIELCLTVCLFLQRLLELYCAKKIDLLGILPNVFFFTENKNSVLKCTETNHSYWRESTLIKCFTVFRTFNFCYQPIVISMVYSFLFFWLVTTRIMYTQSPVLIHSQFVPRSNVTKTKKNMKRDTNVLLGTMCTFSSRPIWS